MSTLNPYMVESLVADLERLMGMRVDDRRGLELWYREARVVQDRLAVSGATLPQLPETVWHYLIDADIRLKEPRYASMQNEAMLAVLDELRRGAAEAR